MTARRDRTECRGCGSPDLGVDCDRCEYPNLVSGRSHYCGSDTCHCRELRRFMRHDVLDGFAVIWQRDG